MSDRPLTAAEVADYALFDALMQDFTLRERWQYDHVAMMARLWLDAYEAGKARHAASKAPPRALP